MALDFNAFQMGQQAVGDPVSEIMQRQQGMLAMQGQRLQNQAAQSQLQMQQIALQRQQTFGQDMQGFLSNPSAKGVASLFGKYPEFAKQIGDSWNTLDTAQRRSDATQLGSVASLLAKGDYDNAAKIVQTRIDADRASGRDASQDEQALSMLQSGDPKQQKAVLGLATIEAAGAVGPEKAAEYLKSLGLSSEPILKGMDQELVTPQGQTLIGGQTKLEHVTDPVTGVSAPFNPYTGKFGGAAVEGGQTTAEGGGQTSGGGAVSGPRSVRNNNPGNLRATPFTKGLPGYQGTDDAGYAVFGSPEAGQAAQTSLLMGKGYFGGGRKTVASIVSKWAPPQSAGGDNTSAQVANYVSYVSKQLGVKPGDALTPQQIPQLAHAMAQFEAGATGHAGPVRVPPAAPAMASDGAPAVAPAAVGHDPYTFGGGALNTQGAEPGHAWNPTHTGEIAVPGSDADPNSYKDEVEPAARIWLYTGQFPTGGGGMGGGGQMMLGEKNAIYKRAMEIWTAAGHSPADLQTFRSNYAGLSTQIQNAQGMVANMAAAKEALSQHANMVLSAQKSLVKMGIVHDEAALGGLVSANFKNNTELDWYEEHGSPGQQAAVKSYKDSVNAYAKTYSKFMSAANATGGSAAPTDATNRQADELNDFGMGPTALRQHLQTVLAETQQKKSGWDKQLASLQQQMGDLGGIGGGSVHTPPVNIPQGAVQMLKANPALAPMFDQKYGPGKAQQILAH